PHRDGGPPAGGDPRCPSRPDPDRGIVQPPVGWDGTPRGAASRRASGGDRGRLGGRPGGFPATRASVPHLSLSDLGKERPGGKVVSLSPRKRRRSSDGGRVSTPSHGGV